MKKKINLRIQREVTELHKESIVRTLKHLPASHNLANTIVDIEALNYRAMEKIANFPFPLAPSLEINIVPSFLKQIPSGC